MKGSTKLNTQAENTESHQFNINIPQIKRVLIYCFLVQLILNLALIYLIEQGHSNFYGLKRFYFDAEESIPTFFSSMNLFISAALLALISSIKANLSDPFKTHWQVLSLLFILLAMDEIAEVHELTIDPMIRMYQFSGFLRFPWVILGFIFMTFFSIAYFRLWMNLPKPYRLGFFFSCLIYLTGAIGVETISANIFISLEESPKDLSYNLVTTVEESFEMLGIMMFIIVLLSYIKSLKSTISLVFK